MIDVDDVGEVLWRLSKVVAALGAVSVFGGVATWQLLLAAGIKMSDPRILIVVFAVVGTWMIVTGGEPAPPSQPTPPPPTAPMTPRERYQALQLLDELRRRGAISAAEHDRERARLITPVATPEPPSRRRH